jgi:hypothetical protein
MYAAAGVLAVFAIGACSHDSGTASLNAAGGESSVGASAGGGGDVSGTANGSADTTAGQRAGTPQQAFANAATTTKLADTGAKIRIGYLKVAVKGAANVAVKADAADTIAAEAGGEVDGDDRTNGRHASATLELRVPPAQLQPTLHKLSNLGRELGRQLSTTDVTQQVADVHSRVLSAQDSIARLQKLFRSAHKVGDVIQIEDELSSREASLESLQARQRSLAAQTSLATINLTLVTAAKKKAVVSHKPAKKRGGFIGGLKRGWDGFTAAASWVAGAVGTVLPFVALLLILSVAARRWALPGRRHQAASR